MPSPRFPSLESQISCLISQRLHARREKQVVDRHVLMRIAYSLCEKPATDSCLILEHCCLSGNVSVTTSSVSDGLLYIFIGLPESTGCVISALTLLRLCASAGLQHCTACHPYLSGRLLLLRSCPLRFLSGSFRLFHWRACDICRRSPYLH